MFVEGLVKLLATDPGVKALINPIGARTDNGIFPVVALKDVTYPYVVYQEIHSQPVISFQGTNPTTEYRYQFSCVAASFKLAKQLSNAVKNVLDGFIGPLGDPDNAALLQSIKLAENDDAVVDLKATAYMIALDYHFIVNSPK